MSDVALSQVNQNIINGPRNTTEVIEEPQAPVEEKKIDKKKLAYTAAAAVGLAALAAAIVHKRKFDSKDVKAIEEGAKDVVDNAASKGKEAAEELADEVKGKASDVANAAKKEAADVADDVAEAAQKVEQEAAEAAADVADDVAEAAQKVEQEAAEAAADVVQEAADKTKVTDVAEGAKERLQGFVGKFLPATDAIQEAADKTKVTDVAKGAKERLQGFVGRFLPSK